MLVSLPQVHLVRYRGCLAPHSLRSGAIIPTPHQQNVHGGETKTGLLRWSWVRPLKRVFALAMATCSWANVVRSGSWSPSPTRLAHVNPVALPQVENAMSRRYLQVLMRWVPVALRAFNVWPDRPHCGYFFGGVFWYGLEM